MKLTTLFLLALPAALAAPHHKHKHHKHHDDHENDFDDFDRPAKNDMLPATLPPVPGASARLALPVNFHAASSPVAVVVDIDVPIGADTLHINGIPIPESASDEPATLEIDSLVTTYTEDVDAALQNGMHVTLTTSVLVEFVRITVETPLEDGGAATSTQFILAMQVVALADRRIIESETVIQIIESFSDGSIASDQPFLLDDQTAVASADALAKPAAPPAAKSATAAEQPLAAAQPQLFWLFAAVAAVISLFAPHILMAVVVIAFIAIVFVVAISCKIVDKIKAAKWCSWRCSSQKTLPVSYQPVSTDAKYENEKLFMKSAKSAALNDFESDSCSGTETDADE